MYNDKTQLNMGSFIFSPKPLVLSKMYDQWKLGWNLLLWILLVKELLLFLNKTSFWLLQNPD